MAKSPLRRGFYGLLAMASMVLLSLGSACAAAPVSVTTDKNGFKHFSIGEKAYVPIGVNYLIQHVGAPYQTFDMFDTKTFDLSAIDKNLRAISADGFNLVRLWLKGFDPDRGFDLGHDQVGEAYVDNVLATLQKAEQYGLHVTLTGAFRQGVWLPRNYLPTTALPGTDVVGGMNRLIMLPEMAEETGRFYHDLLVKLREKDKPILNVIFYFDLYNELHFDLHQPPFSKTFGQYLFAGHSYDLGNAESRQALMDQAAQSWLRTVSARVKAVDPTMLVTASSFYLATGGRTSFDGGLNARPGFAPMPYPLRPEALMRGGATLIDIHTYPSPARPGLGPFHDRAPSIMREDGISAALAYPLPLIAGEFGPADSRVFSAGDALNELRATSDMFCRFHFAGFTVWSWNSVGGKDAMPENNALTKIVAPKYNHEFCGVQIN